MSLPFEAVDVWLCKVGGELRCHFGQCELNRACIWQRHIVREWLEALRRIRQRRIGLRTNSCRQTFRQFNLPVAQMCGPEAVIFRY